MVRLLIVEDNLSILEDVALELELRGYVVDQASDGLQAVRILEMADELPNVVISDILMPNMNGYQLLEIVQQKSEWSAIPFIFLTGLSGDEDIRLGKRLGTDDYIVKPFLIDDLIISIENKLRRVAQWQAAAARRELAGIMGDEPALYGSKDELLADLEAMPDEFSHRALEAVRSGTQQLNRLVSQIILLMKLDRGQFRAVYEQPSLCHIQAVVESACQQVTEEFEAGAILIQPNISAQTLHVCGSFDLLVTVVAEVLRNAALFAPPASPVSLLVKPQNGEVVIEITDHGQGLAPEYLPLIWERFAQFERTEKPQQGFGLGLAVVAAAVRVMGGRAVLSSEVSVGTAVTLCLPLAESPA